MKGNKKIFCNFQAFVDERPRKRFKIFRLFSFQEIFQDLHSGSMNTKKKSVYSSNKRNKARIST